MTSSTTIQRLLQNITTWGPVLIFTDFVLMRFLADSPLWSQPISYPLFFGLAFVGLLLTYLCTGGLQALKQISSDQARWYQLHAFGLAAVWVPLAILFRFDTPWTNTLVVPCLGSAIILLLIAGYGRERLRADTNQKSSRVIRYALVVLTVILAILLWSFLFLAQ